MTIRLGNVLNVETGFIVHGCNAQGVMGSGIARAIKDTWPPVFEFYRSEYERRGFELGDVQFHWVAYNKIICNAITQEFFGGDGKRYVDYDAIETAFTKVLAHAKVENLPIHYPLIGIVRGGGSYKTITEIIDRVLGDHEHYLWILPQEQHLFESKWSKT